MFSAALKTASTLADAANIAGTLGDATRATGSVLRGVGSVVSSTADAVSHGVKKVLKKIIPNDAQCSEIARRSVVFLDLKFNDSSENYLGRWQKKMTIARNAGGVVDQLSQNALFINACWGSAEQAADVVRNGDSSWAEAAVATMQHPNSKAVLEAFEKAFLRRTSAPGTDFALHFLVKGDVVSTDPESIPERVIQNPHAGPLTLATYARERGADGVKAALAQLAKRTHLSAAEKAYYADVIAAEAIKKDHKVAPEGYRGFAVLIAKSGADLSEKDAAELVVKIEEGMEKILLVSLQLRRDQNIPEPNKYKAYSALSKIAPKESHLQKLFEEKATPPIAFESVTFT